MGDRMIKPRVILHQIHYMLDSRLTLNSEDLESINIFSLFMGAAEEDLISASIHLYYILRK